MSPTETGRQAEAAASRYLQERGFTIKDHNWRNRWCEIDLVVQGAEAVHFVEVKYRRHTTYGAGYEYINRQKIGRMSRAAAAWCQAHQYAGAYQLDIMSLSGPLSSPEIEYLPNALMDA